MAAAAGRRVVDMVWEDLRPSHILTRAAVENAAKVNVALGGSTNAAIHLVAIARRAGIDFNLQQFDAVVRGVPVLANVQPSGAYLMHEFADAGGLPALLKQLQTLLDGSSQTVMKQTLSEVIEQAQIDDDEVIRPLSNPVASEALVVVSGNLAPNGAVIKPSAATASLMQHRGRAVVFEDAADMAARIHSDDLEVTPDSVLVLRNCGPQGGPGMAENGMLPIPKKLAEQGVRDVLRISDARMSGTSFGTCVLHVSPESWVGGTLALVRSGDEIEIDVAARSLNLLVDDAELAARRSAWQPPKPHYVRGWGSLFIEHVNQADQGCDFDFLVRPGATPEPPIFGKL